MVAEGSVLCAAAPPRFHAGRSGDPLPDHPHGIRLKGPIRRDDRKSAHERLRDQHAVEGIFVEQLELLGRQRVRFREGKALNSRVPANRRDEGRGMRGQGYSSQCVLAGDLPDGHRAEVNLVCGVQYLGARRRGQLGRIRLKPEESAGIEQQFQAGPTRGKTGAPSNSASSSAVIGAKASGSQCTRPSSKPAMRVG